MAAIIRQTVFDIAMVSPRRERQREQWPLTHGEWIIGPRKGPDNRGLP
ncbi:hypothetical protein ACFB49_13130 [Sphingomonas sp. DBB INV C78]